MSPIPALTTLPFSEDRSPACTITSAVPDRHTPAPPLQTVDTTGRGDATPTAVASPRVKPGMVILDNAILWPGDGSEFVGHVIIRDGRIESVAKGRCAEPGNALDLNGMFLSPGLIDLMLNGAFGKSAARDGVGEIAKDAARIGVTSVLSCGGMMGWNGNLGITRRIREARNSPDPCAARILGWYPEGPFLDPNITAALPRNAMLPTVNNVRHMLTEMGDTFPLINVSPGLDGDVNAIRTLVAAGKIVSMAHSKASVEQVRRCIDAGTSVLGHFNCNNRGRFDAMGRRVSTLEEVALTDDRIRFIHLICDGVHADEPFVRLCLRAGGIERTCIVTDAMPQSGCADGPFLWDDGRTLVKQGPVARTQEGRLIGSTWLLPDHFRNFLKMTGLPPRLAIRTVTLNPAACLGRDRELGAISHGKIADLIAWDPTLRIRRVWLAGREVTQISPLCEAPL